MSGFPPFEPSVTLLSSISTTIQTALFTYENAQTVAEKSSALQKMQVASTRLSQATTPIQQQFMAPDACEVRLREGNVVLQLTTRQLRIL